MVRNSIAGLLAGVLVLGTIAYAADAPPTRDPAATSDRESGHMAPAPTMQASKLAGLTVKNSQGESLGSVDDIVINLNDGKVAYIALSHGGVLGVGDKLFAIPFAAIKVSHDKDMNETFLVLNISKERLDQAPGFDKSNWPDFADKLWRDRNDQYYDAWGRTERSAAKPIVP